MSTDEKIKELVPLEDAAEELATTEIRLLMLIREGTLAGVETDEGWHISRESLERLKCTGIAPPKTKGCGEGCTASNCGRH